ncbi:MAG: hypothetical protein HQL49_01550 [Gammaproteobacteria bacterium]|nr:hypothetical protein [Gammaproteobacteria bacterium]
MNLEKVMFGFFIVLALTLNFGFFIGEFANPDHHDVYELFAAIVVSLIATILKFGDRSQIGAIMLATSLVADLQLIAAAIVWGYAVNILHLTEPHLYLGSVVSLAGGAMLANFFSVVLLMVETINLRH